MQLSTHNAPKVILQNCKFTHLTVFTSSCRDISPAVNGLARAWAEFWRSGLLGLAIEESKAGLCTNIHGMLGAGDLSAGAISLVNGISVRTWHLNRYMQLQTSISKRFYRTEFITRFYYIGFNI